LSALLERSISENERRGLRDHFVLIGSSAAHEDMADVAI
jgi:hypothetical protein